MKPTRITSAIIGAGAPNIATNHHLPASLLAPSIELVALADICEGVHEYAARHRLRACRSLEEVLADPAIDMVQIATPDQFHCRQALAALAAGKAVLLQKPPGLSRAELALLAEAAGHYPDRLKIMLNNRATPLVRTIKSLIDAGTIGELRMLSLQYRGRRFPIANPASFYLSAASGGVWMHNGLHYLDEMAFLCGRMPVSVRAFAARNAEGRPEFLGEGDNYCSAFYDFDGCDVRLEYNTMLLADGLPGGIKRSFIGTGGEIRLEYGSNELKLYTKGDSAGRTVPLLPAVFAPDDPAVDSFAIGIEDFAMQLKSGIERSPGIAGSLKLTEALLAAGESAATGKEILL